MKGEYKEGFYHTPVFLLRGMPKGYVEYVLDLRIRVGGVRVLGGPVVYGKSVGVANRVLKTTSDFGRF